MLLSPVHELALHGGLDVRAVRRETPGIADDPILVVRLPRQATLRNRRPSAGKFSTVIARGLAQAPSGHAGGIGIAPPDDPAPFTPSPSLARHPASSRLD